MFAEEVSDSSFVSLNPVRHLPAGEHWLEARLDQDALHLFALVALDFDTALFHSPADAAGFLHLSSEILFLWQTNPREIAHDRYGLAAAMRGLADDVHASSIRVLLPALRGFLWRRG